MSANDNIYLAKLAEQAERYDEMVEYMKNIISPKLGLTGDELQVEERNLISVGYKNLMSARRTAWRTVDASLGKEEKNGNQEMVALIKAYKETIATEIKGVIDKVINDVVNIFTEGPQKATDAEVVVFFRKMEGDYYRYGAEITDNDERTMYKEKARQAYQKAQDASNGLQTTNPIRLGLALNFSVFYYEICDQKQMASELAKLAFDSAITELDDLEEDRYKDSTLIMQLLKDNLTLWSENDDDDDDMNVQEIDD